MDCCCWAYLDLLLRAATSLLSFYSLRAAIASKWPSTAQLLLNNKAAQTAAAVCCHALHCSSASARASLSLVLYTCMNACMSAYTESLLLYMLCKGDEVYGALSCTV
eukprot:11440-Heterococcus_DN1.PRE.2